MKTITLLWPSLSNWLKILTLAAVIVGFIMAREVSLAGLKTGQAALADRTEKIDRRLTENDKQLTDLRIATTELTVEVRHLREYLQRVHGRR